MSSLLAAELALLAWGLEFAVACGEIWGCRPAGISCGATNDEGLGYGVLVKA